MSDKDIQLSRRKILAGLGTIGVASAGAGLGTTAWLSDEESFLNNSLTAGTLDLKLDYRSTYVGGPNRLDEIDSYYPDFDVQEVESGVYLTGEVPASGGQEAWEGEVREMDFCADDLDLVNGDEIPVFNLEDVKPGDWGEVTISLHICDNPAYIWLGGELTENDDNGLTEPEGLVDSTGGAGEGELADSINAKVWYDENCNNVHDGGEDGEPVCVELVLDASGSMSGNKNTNTISGAKNLAAKILNEGVPGSKVGVTFFSADNYDSGAVSQLAPTDDLTAVQNEIDTLPADGDSTAIGEGILEGRDNLANCDEKKVMIVLTDGQNNAGTDPSSAASTAKSDDIEIFAIGIGNAVTSTLNAIASDPDDEHVFTATDDAAIEQLFSQVAEVLAGEQIIVEGTLAEVLDEMSSGIALDGNRGSDERDCFAAGMTQCLGFEWELPTDVGNEVQSDSVMFDISLSAIQCRHNDGTANPYSSA